MLYIASDCLKLAKFALIFVPLMIHYDLRAAELHLGLTINQVKNGVQIFSHCRINCAK